MGTWSSVDWNYFKIEFANEILTFSLYLKCIKKIDFMEKLTF